jgi:hypothetical protein
MSISSSARFSSFSIEMIDGARGVTRMEQDWSVSRERRDLDCSEKNRETRLQAVVFDCANSHMEV